MAQSLAQVYLHLIFSTKHRQPLIQPPVEAELHEYFGGICKALECQPLSIGGYTDHVHILCQLSRKISIMKLMENLKSRSSKWIKSKGEAYEDFYWQNGYGAFSVNPTQVKAVQDFIARQHEYHQQQSFKLEYRSFLRKYKVSYDEQYVWD